MTPIANRSTRDRRQAQRGVFLIEALIAILIFSLGILGMVAMAGSAMSAQTDARFRTDAAIRSSWRGSPRS